MHYGPRMSRTMRRNTHPRGARRLSKAYSRVGRGRGNGTAGRFTTLLRIDWMAG